MNGLGAGRGCWWSVCCWAISLLLGCGSKCPDGLALSEDESRCVALDGGVDAGDAMADAADGDADADLCSLCGETEVCFEEQCVAADRCSDVLGIPCSAADPTYLKAGRVLVNAAFGASGALNADGTVLVVGAPGESSTGAALANAGAVYVFRRNGSAWMLEERIAALVPAAEEMFGLSVDVSDDGTLLAIGAPGPESAAAPTGALVLYRENAGSWSRESRLTGTAQLTDRLGVDVSVSGDGALVAASARRFSENKGAVHLFRRTGSEWSESQRIQEAFTGTGDQFVPIDLDQTGSRLTVASRGEDGSGTGIGGDPTIDDTTNSTDTGAGYTFVASSETFAYEQYFKAPSPMPMDFVGNAVSLSADGLVFALGGERVESTRGRVFVFRLENSSWSQDASLQPLRSTAGDVFGASVALAASGDRLAVGLPDESEAGSGVDPAPGGRLQQSGAVLLYDRSSSGQWREVTRIKASDPFPIDQFGSHVAISGNGSWLFVGSKNEDSDGSEPNNDRAQQSGAGYIYRLR